MNAALAKAIIDSKHKKKKTIARLAGMAPWELSKALHDDRLPTKEQRERLAELLEKPLTELFPNAQSEATTV